MNPRKGVAPPAQKSQQKPGNLPARKPSVVQPKTAATPRNVKMPFAPPVYKPQAAPKSLQAKTHTHHPFNQLKSATASPSVSRPTPALLQPKPASKMQTTRGVETPRRPAAPPVYRPEQRKVVQPKAALQARKPPAAPPVYRPETKKIVQPKMAVAANARKTPVAPPAYRPHPTPKVLQLKKSQAATVAAGRREPAPQRGQLQPKASNSFKANVTGAFSRRPSGVIQRISDCGGEGQKEHIAYGNFIKSDPKLELTPKKGVPIVPIIIELLEPNPKSAKSKVERLIKTGIHKVVPVAFVFAINAKIGTKHDNIEAYGSKTVGKALEELTKPCVELTKFMESQGIAGGCFPLVWAPTSTKEGGYTFPFLECRSILTLHKGVGSVHKEMSGFDLMPVVRGMDADVRKDPLLRGKASSKSFTKEEMGASLLKGLKKIGTGQLALFSGGYEWDVNDVTPQKLLTLNVIKQDALGKSDALVNFLKAAIAILNIEELAVREDLLKVQHKSVYWPEPNVYMSLSLRIEGANQSLETAKKLKSGDAQQKESTQYVQSNLASSGGFSSAVSTRKPIKTYFDDFIKFFAKAFTGEIKPSVNQIETEIEKIRQTHLDIQKVKDILKWHGASNNSTIEKVTPIVQQHLRDCAEAIHTVIAPPDIIKPKPKSIPVDYVLENAQEVEFM